MKYILLVHHDEDLFGTFSETKQQRMLDESVQLTHQLHADGKYLSASPLRARSARVLRRCVRRRPRPSFGSATGRAS